MNEEVSKQIADLEARVSKLEQMIIGSDPAKSVSAPKRAQVSVVEFLREKKPSTAVDKALVFAVYHENQTGKDVSIPKTCLAYGDKPRKSPCKH